MGQNILPPGTETFLSSETGSQVESAMRSLYESVMLETSQGERLTQLGIDLGVPRPPILFSNDNRWRAVVRAMAYSRKHTRVAVASFMELLLGPKVSQVTTLDRTDYAQITKTSSLNITAGPNVGVYSVVEILTHHLIFPAGTFGTVPDLNVEYNIQGTSSSYGDIVVLSDGRHALVDTTVLFVNTHPKDYLSKLNPLIPQNGTLIFDKNSPPPSTTERSYPYGYYDKYSSGIIKLASTAPIPTNTRNRYAPIRSTLLNASVASGATRLDLLDPGDFPPSPPPLSTLGPGDEVTVLTVPPTAALPITGIIGTHELVIGGGGLPVPGSPTSAEFTYIITNPASVPPNTALSANRGHFLSKKGKIYSATKLVDVTHDFTAPLKPYIDGSAEPFSIIINRGENNEEKIEVLSLVGNTLTLVLDPKDTLGETSLLKFNHSKGELVEVYYDVQSSTGTYFPLTVAGATVGTAAVGSSSTILRDGTGPFVAENASPSYGDEVELVTVPVGNLNTVGERRTIDLFTAANEVRVAPAFKDTMLGCTYRVRKLYKAAIDPIAPVPANADGFLYLADTSIFPAANFSVIIDRGNTQEEVLWISANDLTLNRLTLANSDHGTETTAYPYFFKNHNFGAVVEPAQVLVESCKWEIIETRATGEYTVAMDEECVGATTALDAWYLHEKTPHHLVDASSGVVGLTPEIGDVLGEDVVSGVPTARTYIPQAPLDPSGAVAAGDTSFWLTHANFMRLLANKPDSNNIKSGNLIFKPIYIDDGNAKEEKFVTKVADSSFGKLIVNVNAGSTTFISNIDLLGTGVFIGDWNSKYPGQVEERPVTGSTVIPPGNPYAGNWTILVAPPLTYSHIAGESIVTDPILLEVSAPFANAYAAPATTFVHYTYTHPSYRHKSPIIQDATMETGAPVAYGLSTRWAYKTGVPHFSRTEVGSEIYIKEDPAGVANPLGERRKISIVGGTGNNLLMVDEGVQFSAPVQDLSEFDVRSFMQAGGIFDSRVDISGSANSAFPPALNLVNLNVYMGGHKSTFPGKFLFQNLNIEGEHVDQPTYMPLRLFDAPQAKPTDPADFSAAYKFPAARRLIVAPLLPYGTETANSGASDQIVSAAAIGLGVGVPIGKYLEVIGPISSRDYRLTKKITAFNNVTGRITCDSAFLDNIFNGGGLPLNFRILGDPSVPAITAGVVGPIFWVDYPEFFPDTPSGDFVVTLGRGTAKASDVKITSCITSVGVDYGKFTTNILEVTPSNFTAGESIELKITEVVLPDGGPAEGGFYLGFGFNADRYNWESVGIGGSPGTPTVGNTVDKRVGGVHPPVTYIAEPGKAQLRDGLYDVPASTNTLSLPGYTAQTIHARCMVLNSATVGLTTNIQIADFNFLKQKYRWFLGARVFSAGMAGTGSVITDIVPATNTITVSPALTPLPALGDPIVISVQGMPVDDLERQSNVNNFFTVPGTTAIGTNGIFPQLTIDGGSTITNIQVASLQPFSTALIGSRLQGASGAATGEIRTIVNVVSSAAPPEIYDELVVSPAFVGVPGLGDTFNILPAEDLFAHSERQAVGGVYTGINYPTAFAGTSFPAHTGLSFSGVVYSRGGSREGGIVQEYVEYSSHDGILYTLTKPFYPRYDHAPGSTFVMGANTFTTQGYGKDYRPYLSGSFFGLLFGHVLVSFNSMFRAAGIESKNEVTELGS